MNNTVRNCVNGLTQYGMLLNRNKIEIVHVFVWWILLAYTHTTIRKRKIKVLFRVRECTSIAKQTDIRHVHVIRPKLCSVDVPFRPRLVKLKALKPSYSVVLWRLVIICVEEVERNFDLQRSKPMCITKL